MAEDLVGESVGREVEGATLLGEQLGPLVWKGVVGPEDGLWQVIAHKAVDVLGPAVPPAAETRMDDATTGRIGANQTGFFFTDVLAVRTEHALEVVVERGDVLLAAGLTRDDPLGLAGVIPQHVNRVLWRQRRAAVEGDSPAHVGTHRLLDDRQVVDVDALDLVDHHRARRDTADPLHIDTGKGEEHRGAVAEAALQNRVVGSGRALAQHQLAQRRTVDEGPHVVVRQTPDLFIKRRHEQSVEVLDRGGAQDGKNGFLGRFANLTCRVEDRLASRLRLEDRLELIVPL